jgi:hypothetical protein
MSGRKRTKQGNGNRKDKREKPNTEFTEKTRRAQRNSTQLERGADADRLWDRDAGAVVRGKRVERTDDMVRSLLSGD